MSEFHAAHHLPAEAEGDGGDLDVQRRARVEHSEMHAWGADEESIEEECNGALMGAIAS